MKKSKRFQTGFFCSCFCHLIIILLLGMLGIWHIAKEEKHDVMVVSLVGSSGSGEAVSQNILKESIAEMQDDIVDPLQKIEEKPLEKDNSKDEKKNIAKNSAENIDSGENGRQGKGNGTGIEAGSGLGAGNDNSQPVVPPRLVHYVKPDYPGSARVNGIEGKVILRVLVNSAGNVASAQVHESSGVASLDEAAVETANQWEFAPAKNNFGKAMNCYVFVPISFCLH